MDHISCLFKQRNTAAPRDASQLGSVACRPARWGGLLTGVVLSLGVWNVPAVTLEELVKDPQLTPERLMGHVADFGFRLGRSVQSPAAFLAAKAGDCDDFARLAAEVLKGKGYTPHLMVVHMEREVHVVCYVNEVGGYLDYNRRHESHPVVTCACKPEAVAEQVAASFHTQWRTASEFVFESGQPKCLMTAFRGQNSAIETVQANRGIR